MSTTASRDWRRLYFTNSFNCISLWSSDVFLRDRTLREKWCGRQLRRGETDGEKYKTFHREIQKVSPRNPKQITKRGELVWLSTPSRRDWRRLPRSGCSGPSFKRPKHTGLQNDAGTGTGTVFHPFLQLYFSDIIRCISFTFSSPTIFLPKNVFSSWIQSYFPNSHIQALLVVWLQPSWLQNENRNSRYDVTTSCLILLYGQHGQALKVTLKRQKRRGNMIFVGRSFKAVLTNRGIRISDVLTLPVFFRAIMTKIHLSCLKSPNIWKSKALLSFPFFYSFSIHSFFVAQVLAHLPS